MTKMKIFTPIALLAFVTHKHCLFYLPQCWLCDILFLFLGSLIMYICREVIHSKTYISHFVGDPYRLSEDS